ncbi:putative Regulatory protein TetR [Rhodospirillaceae bacterium LM-1]|nr:putative Regulatory protein TetR [Rhodospirillaceae bacterium LM-1]
MTAKANPRLKAAEALMALLGERGWHAVSLSDVADKAAISLADLRELVSCKEGLMTVLGAEIDQRVLRDFEKADAALPVRDRLFDVLMRRLEALTLYKPAFQRLAHDGAKAPSALLAAAVSIDRAMPWMLEAAGVGSSGLAGRLKAKALAAVYLSTVKAWLEDDTPDLGPTMCALDKGLTRCERLLGLVPGPLRACLLGPKASKPAPSAA